MLESDANETAHESRVVFLLCFKRTVTGNGTWSVFLSFQVSVVPHFKPRTRQSLRCEPVDVARHGHAVLMTSLFEMVWVKKWIWPRHEPQLKFAAQASSAADKVQGLKAEQRLSLEPVRQN